MKDGAYRVFHTKGIAGAKAQWWKESGTFEELKVGWCVLNAEIKEAVLWDELVEVDKASAPETVWTTHAWSWDVAIVFSVKIETWSDFYF